MGCCGTSEVKENRNPNTPYQNPIEIKTDQINVQKNEPQEKDKQNINTQQNIVQTQLPKSKPNSCFDKELCKSIVASLPTRTDTTLTELKNIMKSKTGELSEKEKAFVIFIWISQNIDYDAASYFAGRSVDCTPEGVFANGKTVCSGYSRLYKNIADFLGLEVECVTCYAKGVGYQPGDKMNSTNHEYNVIKLDDKWYPIDSTWGAGHIEGKDYVRQFVEFYFLSDPNLLIKTHFPKDERWQLGDQKYTLEQFLTWPHVREKFNIYGFYKYTPEEGLIKLNDTNSYKFTIYTKDMDKKGVSCNVYFLQNNCYYQQLNLTLINKFEDRFEFICLFNKKGMYKVSLFANNDGSTKYTGIIDYSVEVSKDAKEDLKFPKLYSGANEITLIEPLYDNLKSGQKVKFKMQSKLEKIIILDGQWHYLTKNEQGFFEKDITIQTSKGQNLCIGKPTQANSMSYLYCFTIC